MSDAPPTSPVESISAITLGVLDMARSVPFYQSLGFALVHGGPRDPFTSLAAGPGYVNLQHVDSPPATGWGRVIFYVADVDAQWTRAREAGLSPDFAPSDAPWGERYFHIHDPDGHELSFARPL